MKKVLHSLLFLMGWVSFGQGPPPPDGCDSFFALDTDGEGHVQFNMDDLRSYVAVDAMHDHGWDLSGYDLNVYPTELDYNSLTNIITGTFYTNADAFTQIVYIDFVYNGSGPDLSPANLPSARCWILTTVNGLADADGDGVPNNQEDLNGNGTLNDNDTDGDFVFNFMDDNDDNDVLKTIEEDYNGNGNPADDDTNANGTPDYLESNVVLGVAGLDRDKFIAYPNPSNGEVTVVSSANENGTLSVYDASGREIKSVPLSNQIFLNGFSTGVYLLKFQTQHHTAVKKWIVL